MDRPELIANIVFSNEQAFANLSGSESINLLCTTKLAAKNKNIVNSGRRYKARFIHNRLFSIIEDGCYLTEKARNEKQRQVANQCFEKAEKMVQDVKKICEKDCEFNDCFTRLVMAEYKESIYYILFINTDSDITQFIHTMYHLYFIDKLCLSDPYIHVHDPNHYMFEGCSYMFYEEIEINGKNIVALQNEYLERDDE